MMDRLPEERLKRNVVRGRLDIIGNYINIIIDMYSLIKTNIVFVIVSLGGSVALFVGASILSLLEIIYYFILRMRNVKIPTLIATK